MSRSLVIAVVFLLVSSASFADGQGDNNPAEVRRVPKLGIEVSAEQRQELEASLAKLRTAIDEVKGRNTWKDRELWPDVEIFYKGVHDALVYQEFFDPKELDEAVQQLRIGMERATALKSGEAPWTTQTGLIVRGYVSKIDGSVQPYGLVIPEGYDPKRVGRYRVDIWFHGRGEVLSELNFLRDRMNNPGTFTPEDTIVLHPYGRYCNAAKFAGEIDALEALDSVQRRYRVDENRISVRGFSMGGASAWQFAVHYPDRWFAANPGAGFSETPEFLKFFQKEELKPTWWEEKLWQWYDCPGWAANLRSLPVVAYSGELDIQKQAADIMEPALRKEGIELRHLIGPGTRHTFHPEAKAEIEKRMQALDGTKKQPDWLNFDFATSTLRYHRFGSLSIDELAEHWSPGRIYFGQFGGPGVSEDVAFAASGITAFTLDLMPNQLDARSIRLIIAKDEKELRSTHASTFFSQPGLGTVRRLSDGSFRISAHQVDGKWKLGPRPADGQLRKKHGLQGPIDDAFLDSFIFVRPTGKAWNELAGKWSEGELTRAIEHWRRQFRGQARVKNDTEITQADIESANLVLWGDPGSNALLAKIADKLPISWTKQEIAVGKERDFPAENHALIAIYPNPLFPHRYVVLNSSFTFRDYAYLNNARQVPMLPDWAVVDLTTPPGNVWPGKIAAADFFDERWQLKPSRQP